MYLYNLAQRTQRLHELKRKKWRWTIGKKSYVVTRVASRLSRIIFLTLHKKAYSHRVLAGARAKNKLAQAEGFAASKVKRVSPQKIACGAASVSQYLKPRVDMDIEEDS